jgi:hypothetical protein
MATVEQALRDLVLADSAVSARVGSRMYPLTLPQAWASPALRYQRVSALRAREVGGPTGRAYPTFQIDAFARGSYADARALADDVRQAIDGYVGTTSGVVFGAIVLESDQDMLEAVEDEDVYRITMDFRITHAEPL